MLPSLGHILDPTNFPCLETSQHIRYTVWGGINAAEGQSGRTIRQAAPARAHPPAKFQAHRVRAFGRLWHVGWNPNAAVHALHLSPDSLLEKGPLDKGLCRVANANDIAKQAPIQHDPDHQVHKRPGYCWPKRACHISSMYPERFFTLLKWHIELILEHSMPVHSLSKPVVLSSFLLSKWIQMDPNGSKIFQNDAKDTHAEQTNVSCTKSFIDWIWLTVIPCSFLCISICCLPSVCMPGPSLPGSLPSKAPKSKTWYLHNSVNSAKKWNRTAIYSPRPFGCMNQNHDCP